MVWPMSGEKAGWNGTDGGAKVSVGGAARAVERLKARFVGAVADDDVSMGQASVIVHPGDVFEALRFLRNDPELEFDYLVDLTAVDYLKMDREPRFAVLYFCYSHRLKCRLRVKVLIEESDPSVQSVVPIWKGAIWLEREVYDLFGICFRGHPDQRRLLLPDDYEGHPLRKDYPLQGRGERDRLGRLV